MRLRSAKSARQLRATATAHTLTSKRCGVDSNYPLDRVRQSRHRKDFRVDQMRENFQTIDETRSWAVEIGVSVDGEDSVRCDCRTRIPTWQLLHYRALLLGSLTAEPAWHQE